MNRHTIRIGVISALALASVAAFAGPQNSAPNSKLVGEFRGRRDPVFLRNAGQWNPQGLFMTRSGNLDYWITDSGVVMDYTSSLNPKKVVGDVIRMSYVGAHKPAIKADASASQVAQFITKARPSGITTDSAKEVVQQGIYPGVDCRHYHEGTNPRYDLIVHPTGNANAISLRFDGQRALSKDAAGNLVLKTQGGSLSHRQLFAYQTVNGKRKQVPAQFVLSNNRVSFRLGNYDRSKDLVIDPLVYGTYWGSFGNDEVTGAAPDSDGAVYLTGWTKSTQFPITPGAYQNTNQGGTTAFVSRLRSDATEKDYSTYLGGSGEDKGLFIRLNADGSALWVLGTTTSTDFPVYSNPTQATRKNATDWFLFKFTKNSINRLVPTYGSFLSPESGTFAKPPTSFALDSNNSLLIAGTVAGTLPKAKNFATGPKDPFVMKLASNGRAVIWSRYIGAGTCDLRGMALTPDDGMFLTGQATSSAFPTVGPSYDGGKLYRSGDAYLMKVSTAGAVTNASLLGGLGEDLGIDVASDHEGNAYVFGWSNSTDFPNSNNAFSIFTRSTFTITRIKKDFSAILASTGTRFSGGFFGYDEYIKPGIGIVVDGQGNVAITGRLRNYLRFDYAGTPPDPLVPSSRVETGIVTTGDALKGAHTWTNKNDATAEDSYDAYLQVFDANLTTLLYGTYIGADQDENIFRPAVDNQGDLWVFGSIDTSFGYRVFSFATPPVDPKSVFSQGGFPDGFISYFAADPFTDPGWFNTVTYGPGYDTYEGFTYPYAGGNNKFLDWSHRQNGYALRFRIGAPVIASLNLDRAKVPGGLGATVTGTVNIDLPARVGGESVTLSLTGSKNAFFAGSANPLQVSITIPEGTTSANFQVNTTPVVSSESVTVAANLNGDVRVQDFSIVPWLQSFVISPNRVISGNSTIGKITLAAPAPTGGLTVNLASSDPNVITFATPTVTVPAGQTVFNFTMTSKARLTQASATVTASFLGRSIAQTLIVSPITLTLTSVVVTPNPLDANDVGTGVVTIDRSAPDSGLTVTLSTTDSAVASIREGTSIDFTPGQSTATFHVLAGGLPTKGRATISAALLGQTTTTLVEVNPVTFSFTLTPNSVIGGNSATGTITLTGVEGVKATKAITFDLSTSAPKVASPEVSSVTIPVGGTTVSFQVNTLPGTGTANIRVKMGGFGSTSATISTRSVGIASFSLAPQTIRMGRDTTGTITLDSPAPAGGLKISIAYDSQFLTSSVSTVTIPQGSTTATFKMTAKVFSRAVSTSVTVTGGGSTKSYTVNINP